MKTVLGVEHFCLAGPARLVIERGVPLQKLAAVALCGAQVHVELALGVKRRDPVQRNSMMFPLSKLPSSKVEAGALVRAEPMS